MLFITLIQSKLEYNSTVRWCSTNAKEQKIEAVQRQAAKMLPGFKNLSFPEHLKSPQLTHTPMYTLCGDCIHAYKKP